MLNTCFGFETKTGVVSSLNFSTYTYVQPHPWKALAETFLNDMARPILKNNYNTYYPRFGFTHKKRCCVPQMEVLFLLGI